MSFTISFFFNVCGLRPVISLIWSLVEIIVVRSVLHIFFKDTYSETGELPDHWNTKTEPGAYC